jgi:hypothetical protein
VRRARKGRSGPAAGGRASSPDPAPADLPRQSGVRTAVAPR